MNLPKPTVSYDAQDQTAVRRAVEQADKQNIKTGNVFEKILMRDSVTGTIVTLTVASGSLVIT